MSKTVCIGDPVPSPQKGGYGMGGVLELLKLNKGGDYLVVFSLTKVFNSYD